MSELQPAFPRIHNLDYFRGIAATSIMLYHFLTWSFGHFDSGDFWGRVGIYGVSIFYILSGLTMYVVYQERITQNLKTIFDFFLKRIVRIFPLLWLATTLTLIVNKNTFDIQTIILNYTGLFGFIKPEAYIGNGVWSIGNELVFYVFLPLFILSYKFLKPLFYSLIGLSIATLIYFAFFKLDSTQSLEPQWKTYVNPFNQIHLFLGGYLIGAVFKNININKWLCRGLLLTGLLLFIFYPVSGDQITIVSGYGRIIFTAICLLITISIYKDNYVLSGIPKKFFLFLGEASYSIYLLHQIVYSLVNGVNIRYLHLGSGLNILFSVIATFILGYVVYTYFEKPCMDKGRIRIKKMLNKNEA